MKILIACEYSGLVREEFKKYGHYAVSCDLLPTEIPGEHYTGNVFDIINDGWNMMIGFPPCTFLTVTGNKWMKEEYRDRFPDRPQQRTDAINFFLKLANANIDQIVLENPVGIMSTEYRRPNQIIQPWQFGDKAIKKTCLWLKNVPTLLPTEIVEPEYKIYKSSTKKSGISKYPILWSNKPNAKERSKTFPGIAAAMGKQWGTMPNRRAVI